jgi:hypothetical protein
MLDVRADPRPDLARVIEQLKGELDEDYAPPQVKRQAHPKMHGCVQATLRVDRDLPEDLRHGVFERPGHVYRAWVRFSNALGMQHDSHLESRGMAIKLLDVVDVHGAGWLRPPSADPLVRWETGTQDFIMATHDVFVLPDTKRYDYGQFAAAVRVSLGRLVGVFLRYRLYRGLIAALRGALVLPTNPVAIRYFSQTPYRLGPLEVKLHARPRMTAALRKSLPGRLRFALRTALVNALIESSEVRQLAWLLKLLGFQPTRQNAERFCEKYLAMRNHLRHSLRAFLAHAEAVFEIMVQVRSDPSAMPIDDATVRWRERLSPYRRVAVLTIPRQVFWPAPGMPGPILDAAKAVMERGENMSFSPWHGLEPHRPLGDINEARGRIYAAIAKFRREERNEIDVPDPADGYDRLRDILQGGLLQG